MSKPMRLFLPITKIDEDQRIVYGVATGETPDRAGEICDYATTKPFFQSWSSEISKSSGGKSLGNVRAMHGNVAAGKLTAINFNDEEKRIEVAAKIVDDDEWNKVKEGVYTGFSQGGRYIKRWPDEPTGLTRYTAEPHEVSLVDLPCLPEATFSIIKSDGSMIVKAFQSVLREPTVAEVFERAGTIAFAAKHDGVKDEDLNEARKQLRAEAIRKSVLAVDDVSETGRSLEPSEAEVEAEAKRLAAIEPPSDSVTDAHRAKARENLMANSAPVSDVTGAGGDVTELNVPAGDTIDGSTIVDPQTVLAGKAAGADDDGDLIQIWTCGCNEHRHIKKVEADRCKRTRIAILKAESVVAGVDSAFSAIEAGLAVEKTADPAAPLQTAPAASLFKDGVPSTDKAKVHASMANFHASQSDDAATADKHRRAAAAHAEAMLAQSSGASDADAKSDTAFQASRDCLAQKFAAIASEHGHGLIKGLESAQAHADLAKWMGSEVWDASTAIDALSTIVSLLNGELWEDEQQPEQIAALRAAVARIKDFIVSEIQEDNSDDALAMAVSSLELAKKGSRNSKADQANLQKCHDILKDLGAECMSKASGAEKAAQDDINRLETEVAELKAEKTTYLEKISSYGPRLERMQETIDKFARAPAPAKAAIFAVDRSGAAGTGPSGDLNQDQVQDAFNKMTPEQRLLALTKASLANPQPLLR